MLGQIVNGSADPDAAAFVVAWGYGRALQTSTK